METVAFKRNVLLGDQQVEREFKWMSRWWKRL